MKILYLTGRHGPDYLMDSVFHGLYSLLGGDVVEYPRLNYMYKPYLSDRRKVRMYGRGFTLYGNLEQDLADREDLEAKITARYFDWIIYGAYFIQNDYLDLVEQHYPPERVVILEGRDYLKANREPYTLPHPCFKREMIAPQPGVYPISMSIPASKIRPEIPDKTRLFATCVPGDKSTYIFYNEADYYADYAQSYFGFTRNRSGWDCLRHYEIMASRCLPVFLHIEDCPKWTLVNFPKGLCLQARELAGRVPVDEPAYFELLDRFTTHLKAHLTTEKVAGYLLKTLKENYGT